MPRRLAWILLPLFAVLVAGWLLLGKADLGPLAARAGGAWLGRPVALGSLHLTPGRWIALRLTDGRLEGLPGGAPLFQVGRLQAEVDALSLLRGPVMVRRLEADGLRLTLERDAAGRGNWVFGDPATKAGTSNGRAGFPTLPAAMLRDAALDYRTRAGKLLHVRLAEAALHAADPAAPARLTAQGQYNDVPVTLDAALGSFDALHDAAHPFPTEATLRSDSTALNFRGSLTDPLNLDGADGTLALDAPDLAALLRIAGTQTEDRTPPLRLTGTLQKQGNRWHWSALAGALGPAAIAGQSLTLVEGQDGAADAVTAVLDFDRLDLDHLLAGDGGSGADVTLAVDRAPGTLLDLRLTARRLDYGAVSATDARLAATLRPGRLAVEQLALNYLGGHIAASGQVSNEHVQADAQANGVQASALRRLLGLGDLPLSGALDARAALEARGGTLNAAARAAHASAVVRMQGGGIGRRVLELVSTDIRGLFRTAGGSSPVSCLLAVVDLRGAEATLSPLRLRARDGTVSGHGTVDLRRRRIDLTIGTEPATTGTLALDVPVRVSGALDNPSIRPAIWTAEGRAALNAAGAVGRLLPALRPFARESPCLSR